VDLCGHLVSGHLEGLRATFGAAVSAAQPQPARQARRFLLRLVT